MREPTNEELGILIKLTSYPFDGYEAAQKQLANMKVEPTGDNDNYGSIYLKPDTKLQTVQNDKRVPVAANYVDEDGDLLEILLHIIDGYINELEIYKYGDSNRRLTKFIDADKLTLHGA